MFKKLIAKLKSKKQYIEAKIKVEKIEEDIITSSCEDDREKERWLMHLMYRDGENSTSLEEKYDDYPPILETHTETDPNKIQEMMKKSKQELKKASEEIEKELN